MLIVCTYLLYWGSIKLAKTHVKANSGHDTKQLGGPGFQSKTRLTHFGPVGIKIVYVYYKYFTPCSVKILCSLQEIR